MDDPHDWIDRTLTVSQLCRVLKDALYELGLVRVTGEVSQMTVARSGIGTSPSAAAARR